MKKLWKRLRELSKSQKVKHKNLSQKLCEGTCKEFLSD